MTRTDLGNAIKAGSGLATGCGNVCEVPTSSVCNIVTPGNLENYENCEGKVSITLDDFISRICEDRISIPLWSWVSEFQDIQGITSGMTYKELSLLSANGQTINKKIFIPTGSKQIVVTPNEENAVFYPEYTETFANQSALVDVENGTVVPVADASKYYVNNKVIVEVVDEAVNAAYDEDLDGDGNPSTCPTCSIRERRTIIAVDYAANTIILDAPVTMLAGWRIIQMWEAYKKCDLPSINRAELSTKYVKVYLQYFGGGFSFTNAEMQKCYRSGVSAQMKLKEVMGESLKKTALSVLASKWLGLNIPATNTQAAEAQGILPLIQYHNDNGVENHFDVSGIKTAYGKATAFVDIMNKIQRGLNEDLMIVTTYAGLEKFQKISENFVKMSGYNVHTSKEESEKHAFKVKMYEGIYGGKVMIYVDSYLQYLYDGKAIMVYYPVDRHFVLDPQVASVTDAMGVQWSTMSGITITELKNQNEGRIDCDREYVYSFKLGYATQGAPQGKVGIIEL